MAPLKTSEAFTAEFSLAAPVCPDKKLSIFELTGGHIKGEGIAGTAVGPAADWLQVNDRGVAKLDIRCAFKMDDDSILFAEYFGRAVFLEDMSLKDNYLVVSPLYRTDSGKYGYLEHHQYVSIIPLHNVLLSFVVVVCHRRSSPHHFYRAVTVCGWNSGCQND